MFYGVNIFFRRLKQGEKSCTLLGLVYGIAAFIFILLFGKYLALLFVDASEEVIINQAHLFLMCNSAFYFPLALVNIVFTEYPTLHLSVSIGGVCGVHPIMEAIRQADKRMYENKRTS